VGAIVTFGLYGRHRDIQIVWAPSGLSDCMGAIGTFGLHGCHRDVRIAWVPSGLHPITLTKRFRRLKADKKIDFWGEKYT